MEGSMVKGIQLKVTLARRQPRIEPINEASSSATWSTIGEYHVNFSSKCRVLIKNIMQRPATHKKEATKMQESWLFTILVCLSEI